MRIKMKIIVTFLVVFSSVILQVSSQTVAWASAARFENFTEFLPNLLQETIYAVEKRGWWNLNVDAISIPIDELIYGRRIVGTSNYTNGFVISIQNIAIQNLMQSFTAVEGAMRARLTFNDVVVGYNVVANLTESEMGVHYFTGSYLHPLFFWDLSVVQNLTSNVISTRLVGSSPGAGTNWMDFKPHNNITEIVSRHYRSATIADSLQRWANTAFVPIMMDLINNKLGLPEICFGC